MHAFVFQFPRLYLPHVHIMLSAPICKCDVAHAILPLKVISFTHMRVWDSILGDLDECTCHLNCLLHGHAVLLAWYIWYLVHLCQVCKHDGYGKHCICLQGTIIHFTCCRPSHHGHLLCMVSLGSRSEIKSQAVSTQPVRVSKWRLQDRVMREQNSQVFLVV